jgi:hypothetical protein
MAFYFSNIPDIEYPSKLPDAKIGDYIKVKNFFRRGKIRDDIFQNLQYFTKYKIVGDERPDNVAYKIYGNEEYDYVIFLSNNIVNVQNEWPLTQESFDSAMLEKYGSYENLYSGIHHYETTEVRNSFGNTVLRSGLKLQPSWKTNGNFVEIINSKIAVISSGINGDALTPSAIVTVFMIEGILALDVGDQITIANVSEAQYNGQHIIKEILVKEDDIAYGFTFEIPFIPNITAPVMAEPRKEEVHYVVREENLNPGNSYYYEYWDEGLGYSVQIPSTSFVKTVTNYEYEINVEERKREIYLIKPSYLAVILDDLEKMGTYKNGGSQYINDKLKRAV